MDFFQHQQQAKKRTMLLVCLYILGVSGLVFSAALLCIAGSAGADTPIDPAVVIGICGILLLVIFGASLVKSAQLSAGGGKAVAESLGGRQIAPNSRDLAEKRLYNVVEEMAIAAGVPVPTIYIMDGEHSINAFAAGLSPNAAVIGVNRGTVELLTRDELQGVIAHEFSHILNGDMRMNLRLIGILFGLQVLAVVGYYAMRIGFYMPQNSSKNDKGAGAGIGLIMILGGLAVMILGYIGVFFSALIQAAISRQREFLADASAVQFTRNPDGIAGALKKIGCPKIGSQMQSPNA
ncbi:MAG: M48 family metallopeptidase, partial [Planctomycetaceae bacterium]|nr:M48 family metallopeptidase [Planctomycetaceae bacterium]